jgi:hypothetical protein
MAPKPLDSLSSIGRAQEVARVLQEQDIFAPTPLTAAEILQNRKMLAGLPGLEPTDYTGQLDEAGKMAKLQFGLALARRGFGSMGAQPRAGEAPVSTLGRELLSPLAGDAMAVGQQYYDQKSKLKAAEKAQQAGLTQAALTLRQQESAREDAARDQRFALAKDLTERNFTLTPDDWQRTVNGETRDFVGVTYNDKLSGLPVIAEILKDGSLEEVPSDQLSRYRKPVKPDAPTGSTVIDRVIQVPVVGQDGSITYQNQNISQIREIIRTTGGPQLQFSQELYPAGQETPWQVPDGSGGFRDPVEWVDYIPTDLADYKDPTEQKLYIRADLTPEELKAARAKLGASLSIGEGVNRSSFVHRINPALNKYLFNVKGRNVDITAGEADAWLTTEKPADIFPEGGQRVGNKKYELTVTEADGEQKVKQVVLWESAPGKLGWWDIATNTLLPEKEAKTAWETITPDIEWQSLRPVMEKAFTDAIGLRTELRPDVRDELYEQTLTQAELKALAPLSGDAAAFSRRINDMINDRVESLTGETVETPTRVPESVLQVDPRVRAMTTVPENAGPQTISVVNPKIMQPWTMGGNQAIQLGTGSHDGFSTNIPVSDVEAARRNWPGIKQAFERVYGGTKPLGDNEERALLFSGLWKNLPGVGEVVGARTLSGENFRSAFDTAMGKYNKAAGEYKSSAELETGTGSSKKVLQTALDDNIDALRDNMIMMRLREVGGAWFSDGTWFAEMRGTGLGELLESWTDRDGNTVEMPSDKWAEIARPDHELNSDQLALKREALAYMNAKTSRKQGIGATEFEKAAEYLAALSRQKTRVFSMIPDSRPSDFDIKMLLAVFVGDRDSETLAFAKLHELQNRHINDLSRRLKEGSARKAVYPPEFLVSLDHTARALDRSAVRDVDPREGGRAEESRRLFQRSARTIRNAVESVSGRIIPGYRSGAISPLSGNVDEESTANLYRNLVSAATSAYPEKSEEEAVTEFVRQGLHLTSFLGVFGQRDEGAIPPYVIEDDGTFTIGP